MSIESIEKSNPRLPRGTWKKPLELDKDDVEFQAKSPMGTFWKK